MRKFIYIALGCSMMSCSTEGVKEKEGENEMVDLVEAEPKGDYEIKTTSASKELPEGIIINWKVKGEGELIKQGDVVNIDYEVRLKDSTLVESNKKLGLRSYPFMVGFGLQTKGWDIALENLNVGDSAEILIPAALARGDKGYKERDKYTGEIKEVIPPNADLILVIRALSTEKPLRVVDGNKVWRLLENNNNSLLFDEGNTIDFHCMVSTPTNPMYVNTFNNKQPFSLRLEDGGVVPGLKKALIGSKKGDRLYVYVPADQAYKSKGYQDLVKPNEPLFYNVMVINVQ